MTGCGAQDLPPFEHATTLVHTSELREDREMFVLTKEYNRPVTKSEMQKCGILRSLACETMSPNNIVVFGLEQVDPQNDLSAENQSFRMTPYRSGYKDGYDKRYRAYWIRCCQNLCSQDFKACTNARFVMDVTKVTANGETDVFLFYAAGYPVQRILEVGATEENASGLTGEFEDTINPLKHYETCANRARSALGKRKRKTIGEHELPRMWLRGQRITQ
eukprot:3418948-Rhodomonas_salina.1